MNELLELFNQLPKEKKSEMSAALVKCGSIGEIKELLEKESVTIDDLKAKRILDYFQKGDGVEVSDDELEAVGGGDCCPCWNWW